MRAVLIACWFGLVFVALICGVAISWGNWATSITVVFGGVASLFFMTAYAREWGEVPLAPITLSAKQNSETRPLVFAVALFCSVMLFAKVLNLVLS